MKVLVTGGAGFIGSHTVDALLAGGHEVRILDSLEPPVHRDEPPPWLAHDAEFVRGSVLDRGTLHRALDGVQGVFHFAAYQDYLPDFSRFFQVNSAGTALLYEVIVAHRLPVERVIVASSQAVYGEGPYGCERDGRFFAEPRSPEQLAAGRWEVACPACGGHSTPKPAQEDQSAPHTSYGISKYDQERIALSLGRRYGIPSVALRYAIVQGPRQSFRNAYSGALRAFAARALLGAPPVLFEDGLQQRDYVSIHDVVRANLLVFADGRADYRVLNVGGDRAVTVRALADAVVRAAAAAVEPEVSSQFRLGDTRHIRSGLGAIGELGWRPAVKQDDIVREYVEWAAEQPDLHDAFAAARERMQEAAVLRTAGQPR